MPRSRVRAVLSNGEKPKKIGSARATKKGNYAIKGSVPKKTSLGSHDVVVKAGKKRYRNTIEIVAKKKGSTPAGFGGAAGLVAWVVLLGMIGWFFLSPRRRRPSLATSHGHAERDVPEIDTSGFQPTFRQQMGLRDKRE